MATVLLPGDIAIIHYASSDPDTFAFVFLRDVDAGTTINFTDNGWLAGGGFRPGEGTTSYTAPAAIPAGTVITVPIGSMSLDAAGDQIIAYQGTEASPTVLYAVDIADGNNAFAGDATNASTSAIPAGLTLGVTAVAIGFNNAAYTGPGSGTQLDLLEAIGDPSNWNGNDVVPQPRGLDPVLVGRPAIDLDFNNSTHIGRDYETGVALGGPAVSIADVDNRITDIGLFLTSATIRVNNVDFGDLLTVNGSLPSGITASAYNPFTGVLILSGLATSTAYEVALHQVEFSTTDGPVGARKRVQVTVFDGFDSSYEANAFIRVGLAAAAAAPVLDLDANNSNGGGADYTATYTAGGAGTPIADVDVSITDADSATLASATLTIISWSLQAGDRLSIAGSLPSGITASSFNPTTGVMTLSGTASLAAYQTALRQVVYSSTSPTPPNNDRAIQVTVNDGTLNSNAGTTYMHVVAAPANTPPVLNLDANSSTTGGADYLTTFTDGGPAVAIVDTDVLITDSDSAQIASATITLTNPQADDLLLFNGTPPSGIGVSGAGTSLITLTGAASPAAYQTALRQITFNNTGTDPTSDTRTITVVVNDGLANSNVANAIVEVVEVNNSAPVLDLDQDNSTAPGTSFRATFTENGTPVPIADTDTLITDADSSNLASATITLTNRQAGDLLAVSGTLPAGIAASAYDPATGVLTLTTVSGPRSLADYQTALEQIRFSTSGDDPVTGTRFITVVVNDGANDGDTATALITVVADDDAPAITVDPSATYAENATQVVLAPSTLLGDADDAELTFASVAITDGSFTGDGDVLTVAGLPSGSSGGVLFFWDAASRTMVFSGAASVASYQALLRNVEFRSTSDNPTDFNADPARTLSWTVSDGAKSTTTTSTLNLVAHNDAPAATVAAVAIYAENAAPLTLAPAAIALDVDNLQLTSGQVTISSGALAGDVLTVNGLQSGTFADINFSYDPALRRLTFSLAAPIADYQALLRAVQFHSTSENPTDFGAEVARTLSWTLFDGKDTSAVATTTLIVLAADDAPVNTVPGAQTVPEDTPLPLAVSVADVDSTLDIHVNLAVANGMLAVLTGSGASIVGNNTGAIQLIGTLAQVNAALAGLQYRGSPNFSGADTLTVTSSDGVLSDIDTVAITVAGVNDAPGLDLDANDSSGATGADYSTTFTEGGAAVALADIDTVIADVDGATLSSATITLANRLPADLLSVSGALPAGITASAYDPATGVLTLSGTAALADYQAALRQLRFSNSSPAPSPTDRVVNIVVNDGAASSAAAHAFIHVVAVDAAPVLDLDADDSSGVPGAHYTALYTAGGAAVPVADADTSIVDIDSPNLASATITLTNNAATDLLAVNGTLPDGIVASAYDPVTGILTLTGSASRAAYQTALRQIEYASSEPDPLTATRIIQVVVNDGAADSNAAVALIRIAVSAPPLLDLDADNSTSGGSDYAATFTEGGAAVPVADTDVALAGTAFTSATVTLTNPQAGDLLSVSGTLPTGIASSAYDPGTGVLTLTGSASAADYQTALRQIVYLNGNGDPATGDRVITVVVNDGASDSNTATAVIGVAAVNSPPVLSVAPAASYTENGAAILLSPTVTLADPDSTVLTAGIAAITGGLNPGDTLTVGGSRSGALGPVTFAWAPNLNELIVTGAGTAAEYQALFQSVRFHSDSDDPTAGGTDATRTISWIVFDGTSTDVATTTLTIDAVNDAPVNTAPAALEVEANTDAVLAGLAVGDADAGTGILTTTLSVGNGTLTVVSAGGAGVAGSGTSAVTLTGTLAQINATLAGSVTYRGTQDFFGTDTLTIVTNDGSATGTGGALSDTDQVTINLNTHLVGTPNDDAFAAPSGNARIDALGSTDTVTFGFRLVDATVTYAGHTVIIDGPAGSHTVLTGVETYVFTDGTVNNADGNWLVDGLFYYSRYHDVWNAHVSADDHYASFGWHEGRDPDAFFSTTLYLSAYPDVAASGGNPLDHWHAIGWTENRVPSLAFDPQQYLAAYPDVAAAHVDPLEHFLSAGAGELRDPFPPNRLVSTNGFDFVYYLQHNPDVAAAGVDPLLHFQTSGWREGRDPNALFDVSGYLAAYADVAAADVNPLDHYDQFGWHEGRDPSGGFDTLSYLAAYPDIAATGTNPLVHFLQFGIDEGRSPFADGVFH